MYSMFDLISFDIACLLCMTKEPLTFIQLSISNCNNSPVGGDVEYSPTNRPDVANQDIHVGATDIQSVTSL